MEKEENLGRESQGEHFGMTPDEKKQSEAIFGPIGEDANQSKEEAERASNRLLKEQVDDVLGILPPEEKKVLELRFGLPDGVSRTLKQVGEEMGFSTTTAWRREREALSKLPKKKGKLSDYV